MRQPPPAGPGTAHAGVPPAYFPGYVIAEKYRLTSVLGEGGMGSIWLARNLTLDVDVAVKLIKRDMSTPEASQRLLQEARAAARLGHTSIVRIFDFGETERDDPYIVMEVLKGESLAEVLDHKGRIPAANAVQMLLPVMSALSTAHLQGIVHRDLKPDNIVLVPDETGAIIPKVVDFGIAKLKRDDIDRLATQAGTVLGSPDYMSPEQARGRSDIDERADVWALSVVLYEAITGKRPFDGKNYNALLTSIIEDAPTPSTDFGAGDDALWAILERGLAKHPSDRWPSMQALGSALGRWAVERGYENDIAGTSITLHWLERGPRKPLEDQPPPSESARLLIARKSIEAPPKPPEPLPPDEAANERAVDELAAAIAARIEEETLPPPAPTLPVDLGRDPAPVRPPAERANTGVSAVWSPPRKRRTSQASTLALLGVALLGAGAFLAREPLQRIIVRGGPAPATPPAHRQEPPPPVVAPAQHDVVPAPPVSSAPTNDVGSARAKEIAACAVALFADDTFEPGHPPALASMCSESDPRRGVKAMRAEIVRASSGNKVTEGMREWSMMNWYELAAFAVVRATCCAAPTPIVLPPPSGTCAPLDEALRKLGVAASAGADTSEALASYTKAVHCTVSSGAAAPYAYDDRPRGGEEEAFRKTLARARIAHR